MKDILQASPIISQSFVKGWQLPNMEKYIPDLPLP